jgi:hypothetical protein
MSDANSNPPADSNQPDAPATPVVIEPPSGLKKLVTEFFHVVFVVVVASAAQFLQDHTADVLNLLMSLTHYLPSFAQGWTGTLIGGAVSALVVWLKKKAASSQQEKLIQALATPPPDDLSRFYH